MCSRLRETTSPFKEWLVLITCLFLTGLFNPSFSEENSTENNPLDIIFSEVSETQIVGESSQLGIKLSATRENDNDVVSIQLSDNKTVVLSRNVGHLNFYVSSKQLDTATSFVAEDKELTAVDSLTQYLWQYRGYSGLGDTLLDALLVLSNWPQGVAFEEPELSTDNPDRAATYPLSVSMNTQDGTYSYKSYYGGLIESNPFGLIGCGLDTILAKLLLECSKQVNQGQSVTLTATPAADYVFKGWSGDCTGTMTTCTVSMTGAKSVTATFELKTYPLTITKSGYLGTVSSSPTGINCGTTCSYVFQIGSHVTLTATPAAGYVFKGWSGDCTGTTTTCTVSTTEAKSVIATFEMKTYPLTITKSANLGSVSSSPAGINCGSVCNYSFPTNNNVTLTAMPAAGYVFTGWSGACTGTTTTCTVSMTGAKLVTATFTLNVYSLTVSTTIDDGGTFISPFTRGAPVIQSSPAVINCGGNSGNVCSYLFNKDSNIALNITIPDNEYIFSAWGGACAGKAQDGCTVSMTAAQTVTATFVRNTLKVYLLPNILAVNLTVSGIPCYSTSSSQLACQDTQSFGRTVVLTVAPAAGYLFKEWSGDCTGTTNSCTVTMNGPKTVSANFAQTDPLNVTIPVNTVPTVPVE